MTRSSQGRSKCALQDQFWGDRAGGITDPFGHKWLVATRIEEPPPQEVERRARALFSKGA